jgi:calcineurin-like phosphoesterase family protein
MKEKVWLTSDTHFCHSAINRYANRPFSVLDEMNEELIRRWNQLVRKDDIVWHLGDFALGGADTIRELRARLNGRIFLIKGNHDHHTNTWYRNCGFERVYDRPLLVFENMLLSHAPIALDCGELINVYGHVHDRCEKKITSHSACVCVEQWDYYPVEIEEIRRLVLEERKVERKKANVCD